MHGGQAVTTSLAIADGTKNEHASVIKLARNYQSDLEEFGRVRFQIRPFTTTGGEQKREVAVLNERHATLLLTYMRNNEVVRRFKKTLVKMFWEMAKRLQPTPVTIPALPDPEMLRAWADSVEMARLTAPKTRCGEISKTTGFPKNFLVSAYHRTGANPEAKKYRVLQDGQLQLNFNGGAA